MEWITFLILGSVAGVLSGLFGIGGGLVIVPILVYMFTAQGISPEILTHLAVGTSLATIVFTSINSVMAHHKHGAVRWPAVAMLSVGIVGGSVLGGYTASFLSGEVLQRVIGVFAIVIAVQMFFQLKPSSREEKPVGRVFLGGSGIFIGWASAIFGIGGGSLTVPLLSWRGFPMKIAVATSAACGLPIALSGSASFIWFGMQAQGLPEWSLGYVYLPALIGIGATSMLFARFGAKLAHRMDQVLLKRLFSALLLIVGINFLV